MNPSEQQIRGLLPHIRYEIEAFLLEPDFDRDNESLRESVLFRRMAHARSLYSFFTVSSEKRRDDDGLAEDYGFPAAAIYEDGVAPELLRRFNKDLFHITYTRLQRTAANKRWPIEELLNPIAARALQFVDHIVREAARLGIDGNEINCWRDLPSKIHSDVPLTQQTSNTTSTSCKLDPST
jgi:hypothetical protein